MKNIAEPPVPPETSKKPQKTPQPVPAPPGTLLTFPCVGSLSNWHLTQPQVDEWSALYPGIDILTECRKALAWVLTNPRKTSKGMPRFLVGWLNRGVGRGGRPGNASAQSPPPKPPKVFTAADLDPPWEKSNTNGDGRKRIAERAQQLTADTEVQS